ncbi:phosphoribosylamine--glycine ligase [Lactococcus protaetiae]|uniref:Phosphoribosylamine--glycine ligase n=1 Tax=Lactococcus protaetiae TaxID=2592653 RepID=A0A514ZBG6_9LACT|nr:phosphoribosylamine--glycine ligase [Lactococcus protaetiae]QDK71944.1 phosphoribosylamine--glycine ligase [Lactococcus protaetiae]
MRILVIGSGGREHAIAKKFTQSAQVSEVFCAPGNAGMKKDGIHIVNISELDNENLVKFALNQNIDLTFVGPETALMNGVVDAFDAVGLRIFGPTKAAAELEGSKDFAKQIMKKYGVPTADYATFEGLDEALAYVREKGAPIVIKADGLAAGKGVTVAMDLEVAEAALADIFEDGRGKVVIEEFLDGEEFSLFSFVHEGKIYPMPIAQDHKRAFDGDKGPNTGGMGAYSPVLHLPQSVVDEALERVVRPTVAGLISEGKSFTGVLYAGLILTANGVKTIEFNARFGDPETQVVLPRLTSDLALALDAILDGREPELTWLENGVTLGVVVASSGYPATSTKNLEIPNIPADLNVYYAGVAEKSGKLVSNGGRVYLVSETGIDVASTQKSLYEKLAKLDNQGMFYRHDIGSRGL